MLKIIQPGEMRYGTKACLANLHSFEYMNIYLYFMHAGSVDRRAIYFSISKVCLAFVLRR